MCLLPVGRRTMTPHKMSNQITLRQLLLLLLVASLQLHAGVHGQSRDRRLDGWERLLKRENLSPEVTFWTMRGLLAAETTPATPNQTDHSRLLVDELRRWALEELVGVSQWQQANSSSGGCSQHNWVSFLDLVDTFDGCKKNILPHLFARKDELAAVCAGRGVAPNPFTLDPHDYLELEDRLYNNPPEHEDAKQESHERSLELMRQLSAFYSGRKDRGSQRRKAKVDKLIEVSRLNESSCTTGAWDELDELQLSHSDDDKNVVPYLDHWRKERELYCVRFKSSSMAKPYFDGWPAFKENLLSKPMTPQETQEALDLMIKDALANKSAPEDVWRLAKLEELMVVSEVGRAKCNVSNWNQLSELMAIYNSLTVDEDSGSDSSNLLDYLDHWRREQAKHCEKGGWFTRHPLEWRPIERRLDASFGENNLAKILEAIRDLLRVYERRSDGPALWRLARLRNLYSRSDDIGPDVCRLEERVGLIKRLIMTDTISAEELQRLLLEGEKMVDPSCKNNKD